MSPKSPAPTRSAPPAEARPSTRPGPPSKPPGAAAAGTPASGSAPGPGPVDYAAVGFKCGLEIHQQLATGKLFCRCASLVVDPEEVAALRAWELLRWLRPTASELGALDPAALAEALRAKRFRYVGIRGASCPVEADEEPPHELDAEALETALTTAALLGSRPADEVEVMRKIVIDGSNTTGFQRTALVATGGRVLDVTVASLCLEEDSARKLDEATEADGARTVTWTLDRLGIPLIEIATDPTIRDAEHAKVVAARLGALLRATGRVRRGIGTIRQDLNVSVAEGDRVEVKGVQDLRSVPRVIENEARRQLHLAWVRRSLAARGAKADEVSSAKVVDVSRLFAATAAKVLSGALAKKGVVLALTLPRFAGLLASSYEGGPRLGKELAAYATKDAGVKGIFHSDELPGYGVTAEEVAALRDHLRLAAQDAFVLAAEREPVARAALEAVRRRALLALEGVPREVRNAEPDDSSAYLRPLPGAARMYPETDVPPAAVAPAAWERIRSGLPELPEATEARLVAERRVSQDIAAQLVATGQVALFETLARGAEPALVARTLLQDLPAAAKTGAAEERLVARLPELFTALAAGRFAKEAVPSLLATLAAEPKTTLEAAVGKAGVTAVDRAEVEAVCRRIVSERAAFVRERGEGALGPLMGLVMKELRGRADGQVVSAALAKAIGALPKK